MGGLAALPIASLWWAFKMITRELKPSKGFQEASFWSLVGFQVFFVGFGFFAACQFNTIHGILACLFPVCTIIFFGIQAYTLQNHYNNNSSIYEGSNLAILTIFTIVFAIVPFGLAHVFVRFMLGSL